MNRKTRQNRKIKKEFLAQTIRQIETNYGNRSAGIINKRIDAISDTLTRVREELQKHPDDFIKREFRSELEREKQLLINLTLQRGWPKTYLKELFEKRKQGRGKQRKVNQSIKDVSPKAYLTELFSRKKSEQFKPPGHEE
ncbi:MAG: hypothetical protein WCR01_11340 [Bacteroidota bacterium]